MTVNQNLSKKINSELNEKQKLIFNYFYDFAYSKLTENFKNLKITSKKEDVPCVAIIYSLETYKIISWALNEKQKNNFLLGHCELVAINKVIQKDNSLKLNKYGIFILLEPCYSCFFTILTTNIKEIVFVTKNLKLNVSKEVKKINYPLINKIKLIHYEIENNKYKKLITFFFKKIRKYKNIKKNNETKN